MVTHIHPDHYGLAGRIRDASGAWISLHPADAELIHDRYDEPDDLLERVATALRRMGAPEEELEPLRNAAMPVRVLVDPVVPDVLLEDGEKPEVPGWDLTAIWTPGHSPGHLCFYEGRRQLMLSGDHVLPRITPNIPYHPQAGANPLGQYLASLDKLEPYEVEEVLPAHEYRFTDLHRRLEELRQHHRDRFNEIIDILRDGPPSAWYIAGAHAVVARYGTTSQGSCAGPPWAKRSRTCACSSSTVACGSRRASPPSGPSPRRRSSQRTFAERAHPSCRFRHAGSERSCMGLSPAAAQATDWMSGASATGSASGNDPSATPSVRRRSSGAMSTLVACLVSAA